jgi:predicted ATP-grasp superfamily ATP-dependent carboligase
LSDDVCAGFKTSIEVLDSLDTPAVDEVDYALLVAARHEILLYDLTHWAEDI